MCPLLLSSGSGLIAFTLRGSSFCSSPDENPLPNDSRPSSRHRNAWWRRASSSCRRYSWPAAVDSRWLPGSVFVRVHYNEALSDFGSVVGVHRMGPLALQVSIIFATQVCLIRVDRNLKDALVAAVNSGSSTGPMRYHVTKRFTRRRGCNEVRCGGGSQNASILELAQIRCGVMMEGGEWGNDQLAALPERRGQPPSYRAAWLSISGQEDALVWPLAGSLPPSHFFSVRANWWDK